MAAAPGLFWAARSASAENRTPYPPLISPPPYSTGRIHGYLALSTCTAKPRVTIHTDSTYAILRAVGSPKVKRKHREITGMIRVALASARAILGAGNVLIRKVRGHSGHAGNDIADALATEGRAGRAMPSAELTIKAKAALGG